MQNLIKINTSINDSARDQDKENRNKDDLKGKKKSNERHCKGRERIRENAGLRKVRWLHHSDEII